MSDPETESKPEPDDQAAADTPPEPDDQAAADTPPEPDDQAAADTPPEQPAPEPPSEAAPAPEATVEPAPAPAHAPAPLVRTDLADATARTRSRLFLAAVAVLVLGVVIGRVSATVDNDGTEAEEAPEVTAAAGLPFPSGDQDRTRYWGFANLAPVVVDTFDRPNDPEALGSADTGQAWETLGGTWGVRQNQAALTQGGGGQGRGAVVAGARGDGLTEVTLVDVEPGAGLYFRYVDEDNHWSVTVSPDGSSWLLHRIVEGRLDLVGEIAGPTEDGTTVSVVQGGPVLRILFEGEDAFTVSDPALSEALRGGLAAGVDTAGAARWDRFLVMRFRAAATP